MENGGPDNRGSTYCITLGAHKLSYQRLAYMCKLPTLGTLLEWTV